MRVTSIASLSLVAALCGCEASTPAPTPGPLTAPPPATAKSDHGHEHDAGGHPTEGPHHGVLVELGKEEYHAEVVHDDKTETVTVYLLDGSAEKIVTTEATEVTINVKHDGKPEQFKLPAQPEASDAPGSSSRFLLKDKELIEHLDEKGATATLQITVKGNPFSGKIPAGGHDDHGHDQK